MMGNTLIHNMSRKLATVSHFIQRKASKVVHTRYTTESTELRRMCSATCEEAADELSKAVAMQAHKQRTKLVVVGKRPLSWGSYTVLGLLGV